MKEARFIMSHSFTLQGSRSQLIEQLVFFDDEKTNFLDQYYPDYNQKRAAVERKLADYTSTLERLLADLNENSLNSTALIGSKITLRYLDDDSTEAYTIVFPERADPDRNMVSFLSPVGFQLLMAKSGEQCRLEVPSGELQVSVEKIEYVNSGDR